MGHTSTSQRIIADTVLSELKEYGRSLRQEDMMAFESAMAKMKKHIASVSFACSYNTWALVLFSIILEQEKEIYHMNMIKNKN